MHLKDIFKTFDYGNKGFLFYKEYEAMCYSLCKKPKSHEEMGDKIIIDDIKRLNSQEDNYKEVFRFLSKNTNTIDLEKLRSVAKNLQFTDEELKDMITYFGENGVITYDAFERIFSE
ncbi:hypothetical protein DMUE_2747 [Dictyocoela muelleri]|nr:hypothetical protein DMUE_2747 [Dictyocoela muelleri]